MIFQTAAKINLNLKIYPLNKGERLHNLDSDMVPISLFDTISIELVVFRSDVHEKLLEFHCFPPELGF